MHHASIMLSSSKIYHPYHHPHHHHECCPRVALRPLFNSDWQIHIHRQPNIVTYPTLLHKWSAEMSMSSSSSSCYVLQTSRRCDLSDALTKNGLIKKSVNANIILIINIIVKVVNIMLLQKMQDNFVIRQAKIMMIRMMMMMVRKKKYQGGRFLFLLVVLFSPNCPFGKKDKPYETRPF